MTFRFNRTSKRKTPAPRTGEFDPGKWAEGEAEKWLDARQSESVNFAYHRYPDARAAQGALAAQPCDYLIGKHFPRRAIHLEVKETAEKYRLPMNKLSQFGMLLKWRHAGFETYVLVYRSAHSDWFVFEEDDLFSYTDEPPKSFPFDNRKTFPTASEALDHHLLRT